MTIEEAIQDLKQYIDTSIGQRMDGLATKEDLKALERRTKTDLSALEQRMDAKLDTVLDAVGERADAVDATQKDHERRITRLEHRAA